MLPAKIFKYIKKVGSKRIGKDIPCKQNVNADMAALVAVSEDLKTVTVTKHEDEHLTIIKGSDFSGRHKNH